jgi:hypothetical protein
LVQVGQERLPETEAGTRDICNSVGRGVSIRTTLVLTIQKPLRCILSDWTYGKVCTQLIAVSASEAATKSCVPLSSNGSPEQISPSRQLMNVTLQPQDWLDRGLTSTSSEHAQSISTSPIPLNMVTTKWRHGMHSSHTTHLFTI